VSAPTTTRTPIESSDDGLTLLLDLFALESPAEVPRRGPVGRHRAGPRARLHDWTRRAALWGAGPQGAWRAW
jgi:hypothetical protein